MAEEISPLENHGWWMQQLRKDAKANRPEALRLADALEAYWGADLGHDRERQAAAELRRLHAENGELLEALRWIERRCPAQLLLKDLHRIHMEAAHDAGACARAAIAKAEGV
jgi:hypothetical protein